MEVGTINKLFLELSQFTTASTAREIHLHSENTILHRENIRLRRALIEIKERAKPFVGKNMAHGGILKLAVEALAERG